MDSIISQTLQFGSTALALERNAFTKTELLEYLYNNESSEESLVACSVLCGILPLSHQYINGEHFIKKRPEYSIVAHYFPHRGLKVSDKDEAGTSLGDLIQEELVGSSGDARKTRLNMIINTGYMAGIYSEKDIILALKAGRFNALASIKSNLNDNHAFNKLVVHADYTQGFEYISGLPQLVMERLSFLKEHALCYYAKVAYPTYTAVATLIADKLNIWEDDLAGFCDMFQNETLHLKITSFFGAELSKRSLEFKAYMLGFPIHKMVPDEKMIYQAIELIKEKGVEAYLLSLEREVSNEAIKLPIDNEASFKNETDVMTERIEHYFPFDVVTYQVGPHIYRFTRPEFVQLINREINTWTNERLPFFVTREMQTRFSIASRHNLPPSCPAREILSEIKWVREYLNISEVNGMPERFATRGDCGDMTCYREAHVIGDLGSSFDQFPGDRLGGFLFGSSNGVTFRIDPQSQGEGANRILFHEREQLPAEWLAGPTGDVGHSSEYIHESGLTSSASESEND